MDLLHKVEETDNSPSPCYMLAIDIPSVSTFATSAKTMQSLSPAKSDDSYVRSPTMLFYPPGRRRSSLFMVDQAKTQNERTWDYVAKALELSHDQEQTMTMGVYARIRAVNKSESELQNEVCVNVVDESKTTIRIINAKEKSNDFHFDACFDAEDDQQQVYEKIGVEVVSSGVQGFNTCLLTYGQTGSGKSHTMTGNKKNFGLIPRVCNGLFHSFDMLVADKSIGRDVSSVVVEVVFYEIYNENVIDLQDPSQGNLKVREHAKLGTYVENLSKTRVFSAEHAMDLMDLGLLNRSVQATKMNEVSSRAHAIFELRVTQRYSLAGQDLSLKSKITMVDLAGAERAGQQELKGARMTEGNNINKSLSQLMLCIQFLVKQSKLDSKMKYERNRSTQKLVVPYRDSKLTWLLRESLGGNARTHMLVTLSPVMENYQDSLSALRYAAAAKLIQIKSHIEESPMERRVRELALEVSRLQGELAAFQNQGDSNSGGGLRLKHKMADNLDVVSNELRDEMLMRSELDEGWAFARSKADDCREASLLRSELAIPFASCAPKPFNDSTTPLSHNAENNSTVSDFYLTNLNADQSLSGRWKVPIANSLHIGRSSNQPAGSGVTTPLAENTDFLEVGVGGTDIQLQHCVLEVSHNRMEVTLKPLTEQGACFVNGVRVQFGESKTLRHGDRIILGAFATYVGVFLDMSHTKRALLKSSSSCSSLNLLEDVLGFQQTIAETAEEEDGEEEQSKGVPSAPILPLTRSFASMQSRLDSNDHLEDIIETMDLSITDALREMMFANPVQSLTTPTTLTTPKASEAAKNKLVGEVSMARQHMLEANSIAASLMVDIRFRLQVRSIPIDVPEDPALLGDLGSFITFDKFEVSFQCFANLPIHASAASHGFSAHTKPATRWASLAAAEKERLSKLNLKKSYLLFEGPVHDLVDICGALRAQQQSISEKLSVLTHGLVGPSDLSQFLANPSTSTQEEMTGIFNILCKEEDEEEGTQFEKRNDGFNMGKSALKKLMEVLDITFSAELFNDSSHGVKSEDDDYHPERRHRRSSMNLHEVECFANQRVSYALTRFDSRGSGEALNEQGLRKLLSLHATKMVGASLEHLVEDSVEQNLLFRAFMEGASLSEIKSSSSPTAPRTPSPLSFKEKFIRSPLSKSLSRTIEFVSSPRKSAQSADDEMEDQPQEAVEVIRNWSRGRRRISSFFSQIGI